MILHIETQASLLNIYPETMPVHACSSDHAVHVILIGPNCHYIHFGSFVIVIIIILRIW